LHAAVTGRNEKFITTILDHCPDVNIREGERSNALRGAAEGGYLDAVKWLSEQGAEDRRNQQPLSQRSNDSENVGIRYIKELIKAG